MGFLSARCGMISCGGSTTCPTRLQPTSDCRNCDFLTTNGFHRSARSSSCGSRVGVSQHQVRPKATGFPNEAAHLRDARVGLHQREKKLIGKSQEHLISSFREARPDCLVKTVRRGHSSKDVEVMSKYFVVPTGGEARFSRTKPHLGNVRTSKYRDTEKNNCGSSPPIRRAHGRPACRKVRLL